MGPVCTPTRHGGGAVTDGRGTERHREQERTSDLILFLILFARGSLDPEERKVTGANVERR